VFRPSTLRTEALHSKLLVGISPFGSSSKAQSPRGHFASQPFGASSGTTLRRKLLLGVSPGLPHNPVPSFHPTFLVGVSPVKPRMVPNVAIEESGVNPSALRLAPTFHPKLLVGFSPTSPSALEGGTNALLPKLLAGVSPINRLAVECSSTTEIQQRCRRGQFIRWDGGSSFPRGPPPGKPITTVHSPGMTITTVYSPGGGQSIPHGRDLSRTTSVVYVYDILILGQTKAQCEDEYVELKSSLKCNTSEGQQRSLASTSFHEAAIRIQSIKRGTSREWPRGFKWRTPLQEQHQCTYHSSYMKRKRERNWGQAEGISKARRLAKSCSFLFQT